MSCIGIFTVHVSPVTTSKNLLATTTSGQTILTQEYFQKDQKHRMDITQWKDYVISS